MHRLDSLEVIAAVLRVSCVLVQMVQFPRMRRISHLISEAQDGTNYWDHLSGVIAIVPWPQLAGPPLGQLSSRILLSDLGDDLIAAHCRVAGFRWIHYHRDAVSNVKLHKHTRRPRITRRVGDIASSLQLKPTALHGALDHMQPRAARHLLSMVVGKGRRYESAHTGAVP